MCKNLKEAYIRPFHFFEKDYSFKKLMDDFCAIPKKNPVRNKHVDQMQYFCEACYFYKRYSCAFDNETYQNIFKVFKN